RAGAHQVDVQQHDRDDHGPGGEHALLGERRQRRLQGFAQVDAVRRATGGRAGRRARPRARPHQARRVRQAARRGPGARHPVAAYTPGNALRRTLLSSTPAAATPSVRIAGVLHEFTTIPNVTEDVTDIILNLKHLVIRSEVDQPATAYLRVKGPSDVSAGD